MAAFTFVLIVVGLLQWCTLEKTDETSRFRDRAFINFFDPEVRYFPNYAPPRMTINITAQNTGNVPARNVSIYYDCLIADKPIADPFKNAKFRNVPIPKFVGPKQAVGFVALDVPSDDFRNRMLKEGVHVYIVVKIDYFDGFDFINKRTTQMSRQFHVDSAKLHSFSFAGSHNCIDKDCK